MIYFFCMHCWLGCDGDLPRFWLGVPNSELMDGRYAERYSRRSHVDGTE